jgi:hypothetical protein
MTLDFWGAYILLKVCRVSRRISNLQTRVMEAVIKARSEDWRVAMDATEMDNC